MKTSKYVGLNIAAMIIVAIIIVWGVLKCLDIYTRHGQAIVVPDVKGLSARDANLQLAKYDLVATVSDSSYVKDKPAGSVLELNPSAGQRVKKGRTIYLTVNTSNVPMFAVPDVADNSSLRQAYARILAAGFKLTECEWIPGEKDWVYGIKYNGKDLVQGDKVPTGATLTLVVGDGMTAPAEDTDSLGMDGEYYIGDNPTTPQGTQIEQEEESWF